MPTLAINRTPITTPQSFAKVVAVPEPKLNALTSLRFFAAAMIFLGHSTALSPPNRPNYTEGLALWQGVSFFFVLSGFILAYVYPRIDTMADAGKFLLARFARIWPTHLVAFIATVILVPQCLHIPHVIAAAIVNLCLLQVWTLDPALAASFNKVSWTISVELFFYVCFPYLIQDFNKPFKTRWLTACLLSLSFVLLCLIPYFPGCTGSGYTFAEPVFVGFNPLCRMFEFVLGISICSLFTRGKLSELNGALATVLEVAALVLVGAAICLPTLLPVNINGVDPSAWYTVRSWLMDMGGAPAYGALILLMARQKGLISKFLSHKFFVGLGEISFSLYMFHLSIIFALLKFQPSFGNQPDWLFPAVAFAISLVVSYLNFNLIETPCRQAILKMAKGKQASFHGAGSRSTPSGISLWKVAIAPICVLATLLFWVQNQYRFIPPAMAARVESHSVPKVPGSDFGAKFKLRGLKLTKSAGGLQLNSVWESELDQPLTYINSLQLVNQQGHIVSSHDYYQDQFKRTAKKGQIWEDKVFLTRAQLKGVTKIGLSLYQPPDTRPLPIDSHGANNTDWNSCRLLVALE